MLYKGKNGESCATIHLNLGKKHSNHPKGWLTLWHSNIKLFYSKFFFICDVSTRKLPQARINSTMLKYCLLTNFHLWPPIATELAANNYFYATMILIKESLLLFLFYIYTKSPLLTAANSSQRPNSQRSSMGAVGVLAVGLSRLMAQPAPNLSPRRYLSKALAISGNVRLPVALPCGAALHCLDRAAPPFLNLHGFPTLYLTYHFP
jgi:hypothetical protein